MLARGLLPDFSAVALEQADTLRQAPIEIGPSIHDLRGLLWASIDNDGSLDLDQLSVAEPLSAGAVKILVAIADVDSTVKAGSAIDEHARINTTSVYTAAQVFPMLPDRLSTDLTSLAQVPGPAPRVRHERGALSLERSEARPVFDGGLLSDLKPDEKNRAQALIEDLMIAANGVSARFLGQRDVPSLRRVLRTPERWPRIVALAQSLGESLPAAADARALNAFLERRRQADAASFPDLSLSVIKLLGPGEYALERPGHGVEGHFGLAVRDYTHSTAPNRRFPDLLTQRLLKAALAGQPTPYSEETLQDLATHCTEQENNAAKVERQVQKSAAAIVLGPRIGQSFDAIV